MQTIGIVAQFDNSRAVWNAMKLHIDLILAGGHQVKLFVGKNDDLSILGDYQSSNVVHYSSNKHLRQLIKKDKDISYLWCPCAFSALKVASLRRKVKIVYWVQGTVPDESYLRHKSKLRKILLRCVEDLALSVSSKYVYVSDGMADFYKGRIATKNKEYIIVPCLSEFTEVDIPQKTPNSFVYIGGLSEWQCFEQILDVYEQVRTSDSIFHIITHEVEKAQKIMSARSFNMCGIKIYSLTDRNVIPKTLAQFQYGFLIRKDSPVNYVASPIKFLEYLSCGVNVIMTDAVPYYAEIVKQHKVGTVINLGEEIKIEPFSEKAEIIHRQLFSRDRFVQLYRNLFNS